MRCVQDQGAGLVRSIGARLPIRRPGERVARLLRLAQLPLQQLARGPLPARAYAWLAGLFFSPDWHNVIDQVGAGLATVLGNTQVALQLVGAAGILSGLVGASLGRRGRLPPDPELL